MRIRQPRIGKPTTAQPGTPEKIEVMRQRQQRGQQLFHPGDPIHEHAYNQPKYDTVSQKRTFSLRDLYEAMRENMQRSHDWED